MHKYRTLYFRFNTNEYKLAGSYPYTITHSKYTRFFSNKISFGLTLNDLNPKRIISFKSPLFFETFSILDLKSKSSTRVYHSFSKPKTKHFISTTHSKEIRCSSSLAKVNPVEIGYTESEPGPKSEVLEMIRIGSEFSDIKPLLLKVKYSKLNHCLNLREVGFILNWIVERYTLFDTDLEFNILVAHFLTVQESLVRISFQTQEIPYFDGSDFINTLFSVCCEKKSNFNLQWCYFKAINTLLLDQHYNLVIRHCKLIRSLSGSEWAEAIITNFLLKNWLQINNPKLNYFFKYGCDHSRIPWSTIVYSLNIQERSLLLKKLEDLANLPGDQGLFELLDFWAFNDHIPDSLNLVEILYSSCPSLFSQWLSSKNRGYFKSLIEKWKVAPLTIDHIKLYLLLDTNLKASYMLINAIFRQKKEHMIQETRVASFLNLIISFLEEHQTVEKDPKLNMLLQLYSSNNEISRAEEILTKILKLNIKMTQIEATYLLKAYRNSGRLDEFLLLMDRFEEFGLSINIHHLTLLISVYGARRHTLSRINDVIKYIDNSDGLYKPDVVFYQVLIDSYTFHNKEYLLKECLLKMEETSIAPDLKHYTTLLIYYIRLCKKSHVKFILERVQEQISTPDSFYFYHSLRGVRQFNFNPILAEKLLGGLSLSFYRNGIPPDPEPFHFLFEFISNNHQATKLLVLKFIDIWAPSQNPSNSLHLSNTVSRIIEHLYRIEDHMLIALIWYSLGHRLVKPDFKDNIPFRLLDPTIMYSPTSYSQLSEQSIRQVQWALRRIKVPKVITEKENTN